MRITRADLHRVVGPMNNRVADDVLAIVNDGKRYPPRGYTEELRIPEDYSTGIARVHFGVEAYPDRENPPPPPPTAALWPELVPVLLVGLGFALGAAML